MTQQDFACTTFCLIAQWLCASCIPVHALNWAPHAATSLYDCLSKLLTNCGEHLDLFFSHQESYLQYRAGWGKLSVPVSSPGVGARLHGGRLLQEYLQPLAEKEGAVLLSSAAAGQSALRPYCTHTLHAR